MKIIDFDSLADTQTDDYISKIRIDGLMRSKPSPVTKGLKT